MNMMNRSIGNTLKVVRTISTVVATILTLAVQLECTDSVNPIALHGCQDSCGDIPIPYPFGIGSDCSMSEYFNITCDILNDGKPTPQYKVFVILNISLSLGQVRISSPISYRCYNSSTKMEEYIYWEINFLQSPYRLNTEKNTFTVIGCNTLAYLCLDNSSESCLDFGTDYTVGCVSSCGSLDTLIKHGSCDGIGCCQTAMPKGTSSYSISIDKRYNNSELSNFSRCSYAMIVEEAEFKFNTTYITTDELHDTTDQPLPMVIDWAIGNMTCNIAQKNKPSFACRSDHSDCLNSISVGGYLCNCSDGYQGNPYLPGGCQDIDECKNQNDACFKPAKCQNFQGGYRCSCPFGWRCNHNNQRKCDRNDVGLATGIAASIVALSFLGVGIYVGLERRNLSKVKEKYFQQHGGWILLEKIKSKQEFGFTIFTKKQVEQATNNFDSANILGHGGQGTVYRGTLRNQTVAIKKCTIVDEIKKTEFGKEILILSQINHKNIVKLLGCCLEVEVPMLVYEFTPNGTLQHYIHHRKQESHISLATRLRIAHESAEALAYLHTSASPPIFHGDVKSANILLDQNYMAKVSDFGASILAPTDEAQFVTLVHGTLGYLDPEYMQSSRLTDKSDVYSFGVVLLELITSKPIIDFGAPEEERNLSSRFLSAMKENKIQELLDDEIKHEDDMELIMAVAELAKECLSVKGEERPMMKEIAEELHRISQLKQHPWGLECNPEETENLLSERSHHDIEIEHTRYHFNIDKEAEESIAIGR